MLNIRIQKCKYQIVYLLLHFFLLYFYNNASVTVHNFFYQRFIQFSMFEEQTTHCKCNAYNCQIMATLPSRVHSIINNSMVCCQLVNYCIYSTRQSHQFIKHYTNILLANHLVWLYNTSCGVYANTFITYSWQEGIW